MKSIIITGMNGFVGQNLSSYLSDKFNIIGLSARYKTDQVFEISSSAVIHLAGKAHDLKNVSESTSYFESNFELTKQIYDAFIISTASVFIYISSVKAVADSVKDILYENTESRPETAYGKSKLMAEEYIKAQPLPAGKSFYILRPCMIHGAGNKGNLNLLYKFVQKGIPYPLASFENRRSFLSVENLCFVINELLTVENIPVGIYNVADDEPISTNDVVSILSQSINKKPKLWFLPKKIIVSLAKVGDRIKLPLNTERLHKLTDNYIVSNSKIKQALNKDLPLKVREGLAITANSFRK